MIQKLKTLDLTGVLHMDPGATAHLQGVTDGDVVLIHIGDGHILGDDIIYLLLQFLKDVKMIM